MTTPVPGQLLTLDELLAYLRLQAKGFAQLGVGQNGLARLMGVSAGHLSRVLRGEKEPGAKVLGYFGFTAETRYQVYISKRKYRGGD